MTRAYYSNVTSRERGRGKERREEGGGASACLTPNPSKPAAVSRGFSFGLVWFWRFVGDVVKDAITPSARTHQNARNTSCLHAHSILLCSRLTPLS